MNRKDALMRERFGVAAGMCGDCQHFVNYYNGGRKYFKCRAYGLSSSEATDWKKSAIACGLSTQSIDKMNPVIERIKHVKRVNIEPIDGQIMMALDDDGPMMNVDL